METPTYRLQKVIKTRSEDYEDFVGPLDLILSLLSKNKIEIKDIQISLILGQYLEYLDRMAEMDLEIASEFVAMASHLIYIKTKMLLSIEDEEAKREMAELIRSLEERRRLEEYQRAKLLSNFLTRRQGDGRAVFVRPMRLPDREMTYNRRHSPDELPAAFSELLRRRGRRLPPPVSSFSGIVGKEVYPVSEKISEIVERLISSGISRIRSIFRLSKSRSEIVASFLAILELIKMRRISINGDGGDMSMSLNPEESEG